MKYRLTFYSPDEILLPVQYNHIMQAALLSWLGEPQYTSFLHDKGYAQGKRTLKLYTFSNLKGQYRFYAESKKIGFWGEISFFCSFCEEQGDMLLKQNVDRQKPLRLGEKRLAFLKCDKIMERYEDCVVETASPITIHSTVDLPNGKKRTYYYEPQEIEFSEMIRQNLLRKYRAFYEREPESGAFEIKCIPGEQYRQASIYYQRFVIKGWHGRFIISGSEEMIRMALLSGLGARNGIGCGLVTQCNFLHK